MINLTDSQLYKLLSGKDSGVKVVVLRAPTDKSHSDDIESLRDDLSLALMEVDALQTENKQLAAELERFAAFSSVHILRVSNSVYIGKSTCSITCFEGLHIHRLLLLLKWISLADLVCIDPKRIFGNNFTSFFYTCNAMIVWCMLWTIVFLL